MNQKTMTCESESPAYKSADIDKQSTLIAHAHGLGLNCDGALAHAAIYHLRIPPIYAHTHPLSLSLSLSRELTGTLSLQGSPSFF